jgi:hypothetical protein
MARLRAPSTYSSWLQCLTLLCEPPCLAIECSVWYWLIDWLLHMHMFACMLHAFIIIINCSSMHNHLICLCDIIIVVYPLRTIVRPSIGHCSYDMEVSIRPSPWPLILSLLDAFDCMWGSNCKSLQVGICSPMITCCFVCLYVRIQL